jgi:ABC-2 type transport system ATP-binding protein
VTVSVIATDGLRKVYGSTVAVESVSLEVGPGQVFGFLGPNGAGKTTTIKMLLGLVRPTGGQAQLLGRSPGDPAVMGRIGFLPEHFSFPRWLTAAELLEFHGRLVGMARTERRIRVPELLERVGLAGRAGSRVGTFSKGMQQRLGLAQAILNRPDLIFLDEPTSGLDPLGRRDVRDLIRQLRDDGMTVFLNSHLLSEVEAISDELAIVRGGRVVRRGTLASLTGGRIDVGIEASGLTPAVLADLSNFGDVADVRDDGCTLTVSDEVVLPDVVAALVSHGARVYSVAPRRPSLEDLFLSVMAEPA